MKKAILLLLHCLFLSCKGQPNQARSIISLDDFRQEIMGKQVQLIDVRTAAEYANGHIDDAINIDFKNKANFVKEIQKLDKQKPVYLYCYSGVRSRRACKKLAQMRFQNIFDFKGGYRTWQATH